MTETTEQPAPSAHPSIPGFAGLRRIATAGAAIAPLAELVENMAWAEELGQPLDREYLKRMTRSACAVMAQASLFNSNCSRMLNRLPLMNDGNHLAAGADRINTKKVIRTAWTSVSHAVQFAPELLAERDVCRTLRAAFGLESRHLMSATDYKGYNTMLVQLMGAAKCPFVASSHTVGLLSHMRGWTNYIGRQRPDIGSVPLHHHPARLEDKVRQLTFNLSQRCSVLQPGAVTA